MYNRADVMYDLRSRFRMDYMNGGAVYANGHMYQTTSESNYVVACKVPEAEYTNKRNGEGGEAQR